MKCKVCDGSGITKGYDAILGKFFDMKCFACDGSGEVDHYEEEKEEPLTNEEWFCSLPTEEKAKYIAKSMFFYDSQFGLTMVEALRKSIEYEDGLNETIEHDVVEWLKEPHHEKE